ncbi:hypothetical protein WMF27_33010 [Sorangium sp. So ce281]|uniref:hypothetical protein n=1 Tax=unclassified Sorangium TaxID=2621164 RepID=UPI003F5DA961
MMARRAGLVRLALAEARPRPGARFPHFWLDGNRRQRGSRSMIDYGASILLLGAAVEALPADLEALEARGGARRAPRGG